jgi:hypothetical protein
MLFYFDVDFTGFLDRFLLYECNHPLELVGDLFIAEAVRIGHPELMSMNKVSSTFLTSYLES